MLTIEHLTKTFKGGKTAVSDLSIRVEAGESMDLSGITERERQPPSSVLWESMSLTMERLR